MSEWEPQAGQVWVFQGDLVVLLLRPRPDLAKLYGNITPKATHWDTLILAAQTYPEDVGREDWVVLGGSSVSWERLT